MKLQDLANVQFQDALTLLCGEYIGAGISRQVYVCAFNPEWVVKVEVGLGCYQNIKEWLVWKAIKEVKRMSDAFAPCHHISDSGTFMIQSRTRPLTLAELRKTMPRAHACFTDFKVGNWGNLNGKIVCHDYGTCLITENGMTARTKKADWWE